VPLAPKRRRRVADGAREVGGKAPRKPPRPATVDKLVDRLAGIVAADLALKLSP
jgi:hypothetical protein